ncbi:glycoside hydrolase family 65 protein [Ornithinimicrobium ciconiae]|uniref:Glycoside hydrolase family 65 protein n=1 Tax=Ornithinimicrobium ciconiae TaxID=2594265 RepID=A0A516G965_9MICO|nr:glycosyl hydrolase family 65 protein [Ornithinimicrobium ciconiae]QDO88076.1 glycoside hydrolase family 65 protein [Ornithinimicrobium ciconiae]
MGTTPPSSYGTPHYATGESPEYTADHERPLVDPPIDPLDRTRFPADEWRLVETAYSGADLGVTETIFAVGNGYLGLRGNVEEGRDTHAHGTFVNGFHETWKIQHAEDAFGLARVGQTIVNVPDPKVLKLYVEDEPLLLATADLEHYERSLDYRDGQLRRELIWRTSSGKRVKVTTTRMVSFTERHLALMTMDLEMLDGDAPIVISSQLLNRQDGFDEYHVKAAAMGEGLDPRKAEGFDRRVLDPQMQWVDGSRALLGYVCHESRMTLAVATEHVLETENRCEEHLAAGEDSSKHVFRIDAKQGVPIHLEKYAVYHTSRGVPVRELSDRCVRTLDRVRTTGLAQLHTDQRDWLTDFWARSDVETPGQPEVQQAIRFNLLQLAQASARAEAHGISAKGVSGSGYSGHYFWDTEIYVLPFLTYTAPQTARNTLRFRHLMLDSARLRARDMSQHGALFPWRTINGAEASAYFAAGTAQYHINADVAHSLMQYVRATGNREFLLNEGLDILVETARMWADLGFWSHNGDKHFHIHGVTGPDEYTTVVNDNLFTNVMARENLTNAVAAVTELRASDPRDYARAVMRLGLEDEEVHQWQRAAEAMFIPFDTELGVHPQDLHFLEREVWDLSQTPNDKRPLLLHFHPLVIYRFQVLKQADVVLAMFLAGQSFTLEDKRANFEYYDPITTGDSTLSAVVQSIVAAEVGYHEMALRYFYDGLFVDLDNRHGNTPDGIHVASTGGVWAGLVSGFGGMRDHEGVLRFDPRLPESWPELRWRLQWQGSRLHVVLRSDEIRFQVTDGDGEVPLEVRGQSLLVGTDEVVVALEGMGPRIDGILPATPVIGARTQEGQRLIPAHPRT